LTIKERESFNRNKNGGVRAEGNIPTKIGTRVRLPLMSGKGKNFLARKKAQKNERGECLSLPGGVRGKRDEDTSQDVSICSGPDKERSNRREEKEGWGRKKKKEPLS